jgi:hypothetical protein
MEILTRRDMIDRLREAIGKAGNQKDFATLARVSQAHITSILRHDHAPCDRVLLALGLEAKLIYTPRPDERRA